MRNLPVLAAEALLAPLPSRTVRQQNKPFGGIQLIICGDFLQLPPVTKGFQPPQFCFQVPLTLLSCPPPPPQESALLPDTPCPPPSGQELEEVCPSDPGADQGVEAGRPDLRLSAAGCETGQVGSVKREGPADEDPRVGHRGAWGPKQEGEVLPGPIEDGLFVNLEILPPQGGSPSPSTRPGTE